MNESGMYPKGNRVIVLPDVIGEKTKGGIVIPESDRDKHQMAQFAGMLVAVGDDAWSDGTETTERWIDGRWRPFEKRSWGFSKPFAIVGDKVSFARYAGLIFDGEDGRTYRLLNDKDITATISEKMDFTDMKVRTPISQVK